jgi:hypothetical protein
MRVGAGRLALIRSQSERSSMVRSGAENAAQTDLATFGLAGESGTRIGPM